MSKCEVIYARALNTNCFRVNTNIGVKKGAILELENLILYLYILPLIICFKTFQISSEYYDRLPEKIPMHFDIKGQADQWRIKNRFWVYLMPSIGIVSVVMMCGILALINSETGPLPDDFNLAFLFFTFSLTYLFYKTQMGILRYSLEEIKNIWPIMGKGLSLVVLSSVFLVVVPFISTTPTLLNPVMCTEVENGTPFDIRNSFSMSDSNSTLFFTLKNVKGTHVVRMEWIDPEGKEYFVSENHTPHKILAKYLPWWSFIYIKDKRENVVPGDWRVEVSIDGKKVLTESFLISEDGHSMPSK